MPIPPSATKKRGAKLRKLYQNGQLWGAIGVLAGAILMVAPAITFLFAYFVICNAIWVTDAFESFSHHRLADIVVFLVLGFLMTVAYFRYLPTLISERPAIEQSKSELITNRGPNEICLKIGFKNTGTDNAHISISHHRLKIDGKQYPWRDSTPDSTIVTPDGGEMFDLICADGPSVVSEIHQQKPLEVRLEATYIGEADKRERKFCIESTWDYSLQSFIGGYQGDCPPA